MNADESITSGTRENPGDAEGDPPSLRQKLHWATGDRDKEAAALADRSPDPVGEEDAKVAVNRAHGDSPDRVDTDDPLASPDDAEDAHAERRRDQQPNATRQT